MPEPDSAPRPPRRKSRVAATLKALFRTRGTAGLLVVLPIWITVLLIKFVFQTLRDSSLWVIDACLRSRLGRETLLNDWEVDMPADYDAWAAGFLEKSEYVEATRIPVAEKLALLEDRLGQPMELSDFFGMLR